VRDESAPGDRPDLSGAWILDAAASRLGLEAARTIERGTVSIEHGESRFRFSRVFEARGGAHRVSFDVSTDGSETESVEGERRISSRLHWEGDVLVAESRIVSPEGEATNVVRYRLLEDGRTLEASESFRGPRQGYDNLWILRRA
jgi:hypothetical protein